MSQGKEEHIWERSRQFVPNKRESALRLGRWRKLRRSNRRRKSVVAYWWSPVLLSTLALAGILTTAIQLFREKCVEPQQLPRPGLYVVHATAEAVERLRRAENVRRQASALSDADVGISLEATLPEPATRPRKAVKATLPEQKREFDPLPIAAYLPDMREPEAVHTLGADVVCLPDPALKACNFSVPLPFIQEEPGLDEVRFRVELNASGHVVEVLRFAPAGEETPILRQLREVVLKGRGNAAACGEVKLFWKARIKE